MMAVPDAELRARLALVLCRKLSPVELAALHARLGSGDAMLGAGGDDLAACNVKPAKLKAALKALADREPERELEAAARTNTGFMLLGAEGYPPLLAKIPDPPLLLWVRGELSQEDWLALAIVGSRGATYYGNKQAARFAALFAERSITVVSGLARGVDTSAHRGALDAGGRTVAVVGSGLDNLYPPENVRLALEIAACGAVISEFPLATPGHAKNFPQRNRIISGLSVGVLVAEAGLKSGSLITARFAGEQGREVFAIPGKVDDDSHTGCHALIKDGAKLVENFADILAELPMLGPLPIEKGAKSPKELGGRTPVERTLLKLIAPSDPTNVEDLIRESGLPAAQVSAALTMLEMQGAVKALPGRNYVRA